MRVLMVRPMEHPAEMELEGDLESMYRELDCRTITAAYPWDDPVALVTDDEGMLADKVPCRYIKELRQPIMGNFFICGLGEEDFADLPDDLMGKYRKLFWAPEAIGIIGGRLVVVPLED